MQDDTWKATNQALISRMKLALGVGSDIDLARFLGIKSQGITRAKTKGIPNAWVEKVVSKSGVSLGWIITGAGEMRKDQSRIDVLAAHQYSTKRSPGETQSESVDEESFCMSEMLQATARVLESKTVYRSALASNIRAFDKAVKGEGEMEALQNDMRELKKMVQTLMERGAAAPTEEAKKRDEAANS